jgi:type II secretory pathway component PulF
MYPGVILVMSVGVSLFLMNFVVPTLLENLADMGKELPWPTKVLKFISDVIVSYGHYMLMFAIAAMFGVVLFLATKTGRRIRDQVVLKLPLVGNMSRKQEISRVCFVVSTLLSSGLDLIRALDIAKRTSKNVLLQESLGLISERVRSGKELQQAMERLSYFPPLVAQVFSVGQKSGKLDELLLQLAEDYDKQVSTLSNRLAVIVEPVLIVILSVIVGFILFATMLPILEAGNVL